MDFNNYNPNVQQPDDWHARMNYGSSNMAMASMILGIVSLALCSCIYLSIVCGALAVILALLSRGGCKKMSKNAKVGLILGIVGMVATVVITGVALATVYYEYGSFEAYLKEYSKLLGLDYDSAFSTF